jgi:hypothetical protein
MTVEGDPSMIAYVPLLLVVLRLLTTTHSPTAPSSGSRLPIPTLAAALDLEQSLMG